MNIILLTAEDLTGNTCAEIRDQRRCQHILSVHQAQVGERIRAGLLNGNMGSGIMTTLQPDLIIIEDLVFDEPPPPALPLFLVMALPRPKMLKRVLQTVSTLGVKKLVLMNSYRVEKSYWQTPLLEPESIREHLILGLEQARDTQLPEVILEKRFKPFVEDRLPALIAQTRALVAHPYSETPCPTGLTEATSLAIGPEGGFIPWEIEQLEACGFEGVHLGKRIMRVETAVPFLLARLFH